MIFYYMCGDVGCYGWGNWCVLVVGDYVDGVD